jgi:hypothetical protein
MAKVQIAKLRFIKQNSKGETINLVILDLTNNKPSIIRTAKAFLQDLDNSFVAGNLTSILSPAVRTAMRDIKGAYVHGDIKHHKAGDTWTVTEDSAILTDKNHPKFGTVGVGDEVTYEKDLTRVEGFLDIEFPERVLTRQANAESIATMTAQLAGAFDELDTPTLDIPHTDVDPTEAFDPNEIPGKIIEGSNAPE